MIELKKKKRKKEIAKFQGSLKSAQYRRINFTAIVHWNFRSGI